MKIIIIQNYVIKELIKFSFSHCFIFTENLWIMIPWLKRTQGNVERKYTSKELAMTRRMKFILIFKEHL